jgi:hypothetical protein
MNILNENPIVYIGHKLPLLFNMISLKNHVSNKFHMGTTTAKGSDTDFEFPLVFCNFFNI